MKPAAVRHERPVLLLKLVIVRRRRHARRLPPVRRWWAIRIDPALSTRPERPLGCARLPAPRAASDRQDQRSCHKFQAHLFVILQSTRRRELSGFPFAERWLRVRLPAGHKWGPEAPRGPPYR